METSSVFSVPKISSSLVLEVLRGQNHNVIEKVLKFVLSLHLIYFCCRLILSLLRMGITRYQNYISQWCCLLPTCIICKLSHKIFIFAKFSFTKFSWSTVWLKNNYVGHSILWGRLRGLTGSALDHRSLPPVCESRCVHIWSVCHLWLHFITFWRSLSSFSLPCAQKWP